MAISLMFRAAFKSRWTYVPPWWSASLADGSQRRPCSRLRRRSTPAKGKEISLASNTTTSRSTWQTTPWAESKVPVTSTADHTHRSSAAQDLDAQGGDGQVVLSSPHTSMPTEGSATTPSNSSGSSWGSTGLLTPALTHREKVERPPMVPPLRLEGHKDGLQHSTDGSAAFSSATRAPTVAPEPLLSSRSANLVADDQHYAAPASAGATSISGSEHLVLPDSSFAHEINPPAPVFEGETCGPDFLQGLTQLLGRPAVLQLLLQALASGCGAGLVGTFQLLYARDLGASTALMGFILTFNCLAETPVFYFQGQMMDMMSPTTMLHVSLGAMVLRLMLYAALPTVPGLSAWAILPIELLQGLTLAAGWAAMCVLSKRLAPPGLQATLQGASTAVFAGLGGGLGGLLGGMLRQQHLSWSHTWAGAALVVAALWGVSVVAVPTQPAPAAGKRAA